ncbi:MAG: hypothetical protein AAGU76_03435 [Sedimentibacter sp.]|uniref:hypothetical protein n=1 Tax=Sedimentibacter sp. TaxID=1960295 RepID=UPI0031588871
MVIQAFNGEMYFCVGNNVHALDLVPNHAPSSKNFDLVEAPSKPKKRYIPPMNHPWRQASFDRYCKNQKHRRDSVA